MDFVSYIKKNSIPDYLSLFGKCLFRDVGIFFKITQHDGDNRFDLFFNRFFVCHYAVEYRYKKTLLSHLP